MSVYSDRQKVCNLWGENGYEVIKNLILQIGLALCFASLDSNQNT